MVVALQQLHWVDPVLALSLSLSPLRFMRWQLKDRTPRRPWPTENLSHARSCSALGLVRSITLLGSLRAALDLRHGPPR